MVLVMSSSPNESEKVIDLATVMLSSAVQGWKCFSSNAAYSGGSEAAPAT
jgi:hypothetical protein